MNNLNKIGRGKLGPEEQKVEYTTTQPKGGEDVGRSPAAVQSTCTEQGHASENLTYDAMLSGSTRIDGASSKERKSLPKKALEAFGVKDKNRKHGGKVKWLQRKQKSRIFQPRKQKRHKFKKADSPNAWI